MVLAAKRESVYEEVRPVPPAAPKPLKQRKRRVRIHPMILLLLLVAAAAGLTALGISQKIRAIEVEYELQALETELEHVRREGQQLQFAVEQLKSLTQIESAARERLGMIDPVDTQLLALDGWTPESDVQMAANAGIGQIVGGETRRMWAALCQWVGARLPVLGQAEAGRIGE
ncbi:MAG: hypothetical protein GX316_09125 [Firmicutes bacterium]|nr:hypothetical protein [Bacillota bacterium]